MGGPAMIEGGGLGVVAPDQVGPMSIQVPNGVVDLLVASESAAVAAARRYLSYFGGSSAGLRDVPHGDQRVLRHLVPENRVRGYEMLPVIEALCDTGSVLELRAGFGTGVLTVLARLGGRAVGLLASNPLWLGGAIDGDAADKAAAFLRLCEAHRLPVVSLVDTPGFMVGPAAERTAIVRRFGAMFVAGARLTVPVCAVVLRKAYGLGAMAMTAGDLRRPAVTVAWPTGEFGGMGLEGAVRLGYRPVGQARLSSSWTMAWARSVSFMFFSRAYVRSESNAATIDNPLRSARIPFACSITTRLLSARWRCSASMVLRWAERCCKMPIVATSASACASC